MDVINFCRVLTLNGRKVIKIDVQEIKRGYQILLKWTSSSPNQVEGGAWTHGVGGNVGLGLTKCPNVHDICQR